MNQSPIENSILKKKQISMLDNSTKYLLFDNNQILEDLNNFKSNSVYLDSSQQNNEKKLIESYIDTLVKSKISEQNKVQLSYLIDKESFNEKEIDNNDINNQNNKNEINEKENDKEEKNNSLIIKYKELEEENQNLLNTIKKNELIIEEQNGIILLLKNNIENEFFKNNDIKKYITIENIVDFIKLKSENEQYKKELVLSQALVNSLQSENQQLIKEKEKLNVKKEDNKKNIDIDSESSQNSEEINIETEDLLSNSENKIDMNKKEDDLMNELYEENKQLKKLVQEATLKLNYLLVNEKNNKVINDNNNILNIQLNEKINIIKEYEEKLDFFNSYISEIKSSFIDIQNKIIKHINKYNKIANDDLDSLLSNSFSQNLMKLSMKIRNLCQIEQYNLESKPELDIHNMIYEFLTAINDEFLALYEKVFQTNDYFKESNNKINELEKEINETRNKYLNNNDFNYANNLINQGGQYKNEYIKTINKLNIELLLKENQNYFLKEISDNLEKDIENIISIINIFINIFSDTRRIKNEKELCNMFKSYIDNLQIKINIMIEKEKNMKIINKNNNKIKNLKLENKSNKIENLKYYKDEEIKNIIKDYDKKIKEKENLLIMIKEKINLSNY